MLLGWSSAPMSFQCPSPVFREEDRMKAKFHVSLCLLLLVVGTLLSVPAMAQVAKQSNDVLSSLSFLHDKLRQGDESEPLDDARAVVDRALQNSWDAFRIGVGPTNWN